MKKTGRKPRQGESRKGRRKKRDAISGFSTLNQVAGVSKPRPHHSSLPVEEPRKVAEPHQLCQYCGTEIDGIASALSTPEGGYAHFDCVLGKLREEEHLQEGESLSYIGSGSFGVIGHDENGKPVIIRRIAYESQERFRGMKEYVEGLKV